jgi:hypothetical protein
MNHPAVKSAFGVASDSHFFIADDAEGLPYNFTLLNGFEIWRDVINADYNLTSSIPPKFRILPRPAGSPPIRVISYQGDADPAVLIVWTQRVWYEFAQNFTKFSSADFGKTREWGDYFITSPRTDPSNPFSQVQAGKVVEWGLKNKNGSTSIVWYSSVSGSGHMTVEFKMSQTLALARKFIFDDQ